MCIASSAGALLSCRLLSLPKAAVGHKLPQGCCNGKEPRQHLVAGSISFVIGASRCLVASLTPLTRQLGSWCPNAFNCSRSWPLLMLLLRAGQVNGVSVKLQHPLKQGALCTRSVTLATHTHTHTGTDWLAGRQASNVSCACLRYSNCATVCVRVRVRTCVRACVCVRTNVSRCECSLVCVNRWPTLKQTETEPAATGYAYAPRTGLS